MKSVSGQRVRQILPSVSLAVPITGGVRRWKTTSCPGGLREKALRETVGEMRFFGVPG